MDQFGLYNTAYAIINIKKQEYIWSEELYEHLGYQPGEVEPGRDTFYSQIHPDDVSGILVNHSNFMQGKPYSNPFTCRILNTNNEYRKCLVYAEIQKSKEGDDIFFVKVFDDESLSKNITVYQDALEQIRQDSPESMSFNIERDIRVIDKVTQFANIGWWEHNKTNDKLLASSNMYKLFDLDQDQEININDIYEKIPDEYNSKILEAISRQDNVFSDEIKVVFGSGKTKWVHVKIEFTWLDGLLVKSFGVAQDVTRQKQTEQHLIRVQELAQVGWYEVDYQNMEDSRASDEFMKIHNYRPDEPNNKPEIETFLSKIHPDDRDSITYLKHIDDPDFTQWADEEYRVQDKDGHIKYVQAYGEIVRDKNGNPIKAIGVTVDVTKLKLSELHLQRVQSLSKVGWYEVDFVTPENSKISEEYKKIHSFIEGDPFDPENYQKHVHPDDLYLIDRFNHPESLEDWSFLRFRMIDKYGTFHYFESHGEVMRSPEGDPIGYLGIIQNQTESVRLEMRLAEAQRQAKVAWFEIDTVNPLNNVYSDEFLKMHGNPSFELISDGEKYMSLVHPDDHENFAQFLQSDFEKIDHFKIEYRVKNDEGEYRNLRSIARLIEAKKGFSRRIIGTIQDITELKETEKKLKLAQKISRTGWYEYDLRNFENSRFSEEWLQMHGYSGFPQSEQEYIAKVYPKERKQIPDSRTFIKSMPNGWENLEFRIKVDNGETRFISNTSQIVYDGQEPVKVFGVTRDVTDMREAQKELFQSERRYRLLSETSRDIILLLDGKPGETTISYISDSVKPVLGYDKEELIGIRGLNLFHQEDLKAYMQDIKPLLEKGEVVKMEFRVRKKSGEYLWTEALVSPFIEGSEKKLRLSVRDISDRKAVEEELVRSNNDLTALIKATENLVFIIDEQRVIEGFIAQKEKMEIPVSKIKGSYITEFWTGDIGNGIVNIIETAFTEKKSYEYEYQEGSAWNRARAHHYSGYDGQSRVCVVIEIITLQKKAEEELKKSASMAKELSRMRTNFVSMASHQFRTPLTVIKSNMQLMEAAKVDHPIAKKVSARLTNEVDRLVALVEDMLLIGKVQSGHMEAKLEQVDLVDLVKDIARDVNDTQSDGRKLIPSIHGKPQLVKGDPSLLRHAILNLATNAFKYSQGQPTPQVNVWFNDTIKIDVQDFGIGIKEEDQARIFKDFYRAENAREFNGTGLGLSVTREFLKLNNCDIHLKSEIGNGATFSITFNPVN
ncbi:MAG: PAS domain-containing protein [Cyclobacteriaceae bacterium]